MLTQRNDRVNIPDDLTEHARGVFCQFHDAGEKANFGHGDIHIAHKQRKQKYALRIDDSTDLPHFGQR